MRSEMAVVVLVAFSCARREARGETRGPWAEVARLIVDKQDRLSGRKVYVNVLGRALRGEFIRAGSEGLTVLMLGHSTDVPWKDMSPKRLSSIALRVAESPRDYSSIVRYLKKSGEDAEIARALDKMRGVFPEDAARLRREILGEAVAARPAEVPTAVPAEAPAVEAPAAVPAGAAGDVFAVSDVYGLKPDGTCFELTKGDFGAFRGKNVHWDAAASTVRLYGAKNEEVAVQLVIPRKGEGFSCRLEGLEGIPADRVTFSVVAWVKTGGAHVPELVIPLDGSFKGMKSFDVPFKVQGLPAPGNKVGVVLMEVWIPKNARAGEKRGVVSVLKGDEVVSKLNVSLTVFDFAIPDVPAYRLDLLSYSSPLSALGMDARMRGGDADLKTPPEAIALEQSIYKLTLDNRAFLNILPYHSQRGSPRYAYPVIGKGASAKISSFKGFDERFGPILDGKTNKYGEPPAAFTLAFNINYPYGMMSNPGQQFDFTPFKTSVPDGPGKDPRLKEYEETWRAVAQQYVDHFAEKGWKKTLFEVYFNQKPNRARNRTPWKLDEPTSGPDYKGLHYLFKVAKWAFAGAEKKGVKIVTRIDIGHWECDRFLTPEGKPTKGYKGKRYNRDNAASFLKTTVDRWVVGVTHSEGAQHLIKDYVTEKVLFDQYGTSGYSSRDLAVHSGAFAGIAWKHAFMGVQGRVLYKVDIRRGDPNGPGDHCCLYNGTPAGFKGVLCSRRLKLWRDSTNAYDYIMLARKKDQTAADALLAKVVKMGPATNEKYRRQSKSRGFWFTNNVEDVTRARCILAGIITGRDYGMKLEGWSESYTPCGAPDRIVGYD